MKDRKITRLKAVPKNFAGRRKSQLPSVVDRREPRREEQVQRVRHDVYHYLGDEPPLTPREFADVARGIHDLARAKEIERRCRREDAWFVAVCVFATPLIIGGSIALIRCHF